MIGAQTNVIGDIIKSRMIRGVNLQETDGALNTFIMGIGSREDQRSP